MTSSPMKDADSITDPTDWVGTAVADLQPVENALRCQVCKEFYSSPVMTSCAHTFCSICIRRCLSHDGRCPTCRSEDQSIRLRRNTAIEELVTAFAYARPAILQLARDVSELKTIRSTVPAKRKPTVSGIEEQDVETGRCTRKTRLQLREAQKIQSSESSQQRSSSGIEDDEKQEEGSLVQCPICQTSMKEEDVSPHIDKAHLASTTPSTQIKASFPQRTNASEIPDPRKRDRLAQLNYALLTDNALRKKLTALGIPSFGNKQLMIRRHKEWVDIHNANSDAARPYSKRELLKNLDTWERTQGGLARSNDTVNGVMSKDFDGTAWSQKNSSDFKDLIAQARAKRVTNSTAGAGSAALSEDTVTRDTT